MSDVCKCRVCREIRRLAKGLRNPQAYITVKDETSTQFSPRSNMFVNFSKES